MSQSRWVEVQMLGGGWASAPAACYHNDAVIKMEQQRAERVVLAHGTRHTRAS